MSQKFFPNYPSYIVTSPFGMRFHPVDKVNKMHNGIDLVATKDGETGQVDKIMAHTGGIVDGVGFDPDAGNFVRIKVDLDTKMYYFHLRDMSSLTAGEEVQAGQIIGTMGKTGKVTNNHLHFGIKKNGKWIDPAPYLEADYPITKTYGVVTYTFLRIRKGAGTGYEEVGQLKQGDRVEILETKAAGGATWGRIDRGWICLTGYVKLETVTESTPKTDQPTESDLPNVPDVSNEPESHVKTYGTVTGADGLNVRKTPNGTVCGALYRGDRVEILETQKVGNAVWGRYTGGWFCITRYVNLETVTEGPGLPHENDTLEKEETTFNLTCRVLRRGCEGKDVECLQAMLVGLGYNLGNTGPKKNGIDGSYGPKTENGVECFQEDTDGTLKVNGVFGLASHAYAYGVKGGN